MARIRTVKPSFWKHEELSELPECVHMLAGALLNYADDEGYFNANAKLVKAECCPLREPSVSIHDSLIQLSKIGYVRLGTAPDGKRYGHVINFEEHQRVNRKTDSKIKKLHITWDDSSIAHVQLTDDSHTEGKGREGKGKDKDAAPEARISVVPVSTEEADLFRRGKEILGNSSGGLIKKLLAAKEGRIPLARAALEMAATKQDPREYIGAVINNRDGAAALRARGEAW